MAGKQDWFAAGLQAEGKRAAVPTIADMVREGVPTCGLNERVSEARARTERAGWDACVVVNAQHIVLGILRHQALQSDGTATAEQVMTPGPGTVRPNVPAEDILDRLRKRNSPSVLVTTSDGELIGMAYREDIEVTLAHEAAHEHQPESAGGTP